MTTNLRDVLTAEQPENSPEEMIVAGIPIVKCSLLFAQHAAKPRLSLSSPIMKNRFTAKTVISLAEGKYQEISGAHDQAKPPEAYAWGGFASLRGRARKW